MVSEPRALTDEETRNTATLHALAALLEFENGEIVRDRGHHNLGAQFVTRPGLW